MWFCVGFVFCGVVLGVRCSLAITVLMMVKLVAFLCVVAVSALRLYFMVSWVGL